MSIVQHTTSPACNFSPEKPWEENNNSSLKRFLERVKEILKNLNFALLCIIKIIVHALSDSTKTFQNFK